MLGLVDKIVLISMFAGTVTFFLVHLAGLRYLPVRYTHQVMTGSFGLGLFLNLAAGVYFFIKYLKPLAYSDGSLWIVLLISTLIYCLAVFQYIVWVFGMAEAAVRIRLLCEIENASPQGLTLEEIYKRYGVDKILEIRLNRLIGSGHLCFDGTSYQIKNKILFFQIFVLRTFKQLLGICP